MTKTEVHVVASRKLLIKDLGLVAAARANGTAINVDELPLEGRQLEITLAISEAVEKKRAELIREKPMFALSSFLDGAKKTIYDSMNWDELFCTYPDILDDIKNRTTANSTDIISCALALRPNNSTAVFWMLQYEQVVARRWLEKLAQTLMAPSKEDVEAALELQKQAVIRDLKSERTRQLTDASHKKTRAMKAEACRLYAAKDRWPSIRQAAKSITPQVQIFGKENHGHQLSADRAELTVYEWLLKIGKNQGVPK